ncbi:unnamed protein product, partial [marine sediment metagenome]
MIRLKHIGLIAAVLACVALLAPRAAARPLYHETTTITLDDGTIVNLILDDKGMPKPSRRNTLPKRINWPKQKMLRHVAKREAFDTLKKGETQAANSTAPVRGLART